ASDPRAPHPSPPSPRDAVARSFRRDLTKSSHRLAEALTCGFRYPVRAATVGRTVRGGAVGDHSRDRLPAAWDDRGRRDTPRHRYRRPEAARPAPGSPPPPEQAP